MIFENIKLALGSLKANKLRSLLTMLGIIIGIMSITSIVYIGNAMTASVTKELSSFGSRNINVNLIKKDSDMAFYESYDDEENRGASLESKPQSDDMISEETILMLGNKYGAEIDGISISQQKNQAEARENDDIGKVTVLGINTDYSKANQVKLLSGRMVSEFDIKNRSNVAVVSNLLVNIIYGNDPNVIGKTVKIYSKDSIEVYEIIGIYEDDAMKYTTNINDIRSDFYIPLSTVKESMVEKNYSSLTIVGKSENIVKDLTNKLQREFDLLYSNNKEWKVQVSNLASMINSITRSVKKISLAITFIGGISLLVGGIGVMNIMLVSVTERTREIGTKKALGAKRKHIQEQFVIEAIIISFIGGLIGLILGSLIGGGISIIFKAKFEFSPVVVVISILFSLGIGVFFGYYPAQKAAKLDPIEALRYE